MRAIVHYLVALGLLTLYGGQVCPFIEELTFLRWSAILSMAFVPIVLLRFFALPRLVAAAPLHDQPGRQFLLEFWLLVISGVFIALHNNMVLDFPHLESGLKVVVGFVVFGYFIGLDLALERERRTGEEIIRRKLPPPETVRYASLTRKFTLFALSTLALVGIVLILIVVKDLLWLTTIDYAQDGRHAMLLIFMEISFILAALLVYVFTIIRSYTRNLRLFFGNETRILRRVTRGDLDEFVPAVTRDEFGEIAAHTNTMIDGLRERERVKNVLGKAVSPSIAKRLMDQAADGLCLGGATQQLVILFSDIRSFTRRAEASAPETVIGDLNAWFGEAVAAVNGHGGVVDKFIGDGLLAVFGLDGEPDASRKAVDCARDMLVRLERLNPSLSAPMSVGVGIHKGEVLAGIVGSPERLEFTVIGDAVNTASRIESMTRNLPSDILVSEAVVGDLSGVDEWVDHGPQPLKGKAATIRLYGI